MTKYPIQLSVNNYPNLSNLIPGQEVTMTIKGRVGTRVFGGSDDVLSFIPESVEVMQPERKISPQEYLLSRIDQKIGSQNTPLGG